MRFAPKRPAVAALVVLTAVLMTACSGSDPAEPDVTAVARYRPWPLGDLGVYTAQVAFDRAGEWRLEISVDGTRVAPATSLGPTPGTPALSATVISTDLGVGVNRLVFALLDRGSNTAAKKPEAQVSLYRPGTGFDDVTTTVQVKEESSTPAIGSSAPPSVNKTGRDVETLDHLTTSPTPDVDLYGMTIRDALSSGIPLVVSFATPAFCQTATCGPQVEVLSKVKDRYRGRANFIHVEVFDNPHEIEGDLSRAHPVPSVEEWGLPTEPWTFIVDGDGTVAAKFEAFATAEEIEEGLAGVLQ